MNTKFRVTNMFRLIHISLFLLVINCIILNQARVIHKKKRNTKTCGYESCPQVDPTKLNIHIVAHSHDDVGWLKTVDQYLYGQRNNLQSGNVQKILNSAVKSLLENPERRFIYVEIAFLWKWWLHQNKTQREIVRSLIEEGRLEIIGGGWSMNDEAVTHYQSVIDQFSWGFRRVNDMFGKCALPKIGWQIDPFGHSREQASIFAQMGFDGLLFGRLDYQDKYKRMKTKTMEMIWKGSSSLGRNSNLFTSVLYNLYHAPQTFCFDVYCSDLPLIDDPEDPSYNIKRRVKDFLSFVKSQHANYRTNNVIMTMGGDFHYEDADKWFTNLDKLIKNVNKLKGSKYNAIYSTPSCYLKAVNDAQLSWPTKSDDFFPYASEAHAYWTGYYTSRPTLKFFERMGNNFLQVVKQLLVLNNKPNNKQLNELREAMGILQHHDAVTGTEKQHVANDYSKILFKSIRDGIKLSENALKHMMKKDQSLDMSSVKFYSCLLLNISSCQHTEESKHFVVTMYNPTSRPLSTYVRLPVTRTSYRVKDHFGLVLLTQVVPVPKEVLEIPGRQSSAIYELVFLARQIPALGYQSFYIRQKTKAPAKKPVSCKSRLSIGNDKYNISINPNGNVIVKSGSITMNQSFQYYIGYNGERPSGAYNFRPDMNRALDFNYDGDFQIYKGPLVNEIHLTINKWVSQVVRIYNEESRLEFSWLVGPINICNKTGKEIVTKYSTNLESIGTFYTDSNGREMMKRQRNMRSTWDIDLQEPVSSNYYPVTTKICLKDKQKKFKLSVLTDRAQGGTSLKDGEIELMIHRRLLKDDDFGVAEALNEVAYKKGLVARGEHSILLGSNSDEFILREKTQALKMSLRPWIFISPIKNVCYNKWKIMYKMQNAGLGKPLPPNVNILTLEPWKDGTVLLRLEHIFELHESNKYSVPVDVNIQDLFSAFRITSVKETTLGGNQWLEENERLKWKSEENYSDRKNNCFVPLNFKDKNEIIVHLKPMQIRTFIIELLLQTN